MNRSHKSRPAPPRPAEAKTRTGEVVALSGNSGRPPGTPVELIPVGPPVEILEASPSPRVQLVVALRINRGSAPAPIALATACLVSVVQTADRTLKLKVDPVRSSATGEEVLLVFTPGLPSVLTVERLEKAAEAARVAVAEFEGATLVRAEVVPQS